MFRRVMFVASLIIGLSGLGWLAQGAYIQAKAMLAQQLLQSAWQQTLHGQTKVKPWAWADTWPIARLSIPSRQVDLIVLEGASGSSLAFAPGHLHGTPAPGGIGFSVISAHRDTHFSFLRHVKSGEILHLQTSTGDTQTFQVTAMDVVDADDAVIPLYSPVRGIVLVTCYPFDSLGTASSQRYLVYAVETTQPVSGDVRQIPMDL